eukprot:CAMPEP_0172550888 /NCGR_PEP_ID=MMETSP1067-20121228/33395_1 /TAXON_ID=265564 ORGANISM="Thalassiosira punctigera, Strain Tpunct2005C2" /NCGR_SAMPLE_ID=MMETSP1067 /ASSEMBLY_ACC=CAM_ASM_000444 /LENGTH=561 /DNA_ID=CAMNT_0013338569 /DNA_START=168 /DNA_END=1850 /DNA_ORIENTATION=-
MVKIGKMFKKAKGDDASFYNKIGKRKGDSSPTPEVTTAAPADHSASESAGRSIRRMVPKKPSGKSPPQPAIQESPSPIVEEARDEAPSPPVSEGASEPARDDIAEQRNILDPGSASGSAEEASFEETVQTSEEDASQTYEESGTVETYDEEVEEEEEDLSYKGTEEEKSYDCEETYSGTYGGDETATQPDNNSTVHTATRSVGTAKGNEMSKKYFHKDVVLNSLEDGANSLVIRAMYFIPKPKAEDHVVVKIEASTISARDCMKCKGIGLTRSMLPFVPGFEVVGTVQTLGDQAKSEGQFREGDRVAGVSTFGGGNSRFISIPAKRLTKISNNVKSTQAVCMIADYMAALKALRLAKKAGSPFTGMNILITDGFSPIGQAVINLASMEGANIYCCADESKHSYLASLGAKCFVKNPEVWLPTATGTFDVVIDNSCVDSYSSSWFAINQKGSLVCIAPVYNIDNDDMPNNGCGIVDITELKQKWAGLKAKYMMTQTSFLNTVTCYDEDTEQYKQDLRYLMFLLERGDVKPKVAERVSLDDVPDAQRLMQSGRANGTVVCVPW